MPKLKTKSSVKKRFRLTATGKVSKLTLRQQFEAFELPNET